MKKDDVVVEMLKFGKRNIEKGITKTQLENHLETNCDIKDISNIKLTVALYWTENFKSHDKYPDKNILNSAGYFRYMQYIDIKNARKNSLYAKVFSSISILIAAIAIYTSSNGINDVNINSMSDTLKNEFLTHPKKIDSCLKLINLQVDTIKNNSDTIALKIDSIINNTKK